MKYLISGRDGQLARAFITELEKNSIVYFAPSEEDFDITNETKIHKVIDNCRPDVLVNCAAYNLVDESEKHYEKALAVNASGPELLSGISEKHGIYFVHYSTDYVFDGKSESAYTEEDIPNPINKYGFSKLEGEKKVLNNNKDAVVFRTSWVYGNGKQNFIHKLLQLSKKNGVLKISDDEFSVPTWTGLMVELTIKSVKTGLSGLFHLVNSGYCSRCEWAEYVLNYLGINKKTEPVSSGIFNLPAPRPRFSAMSNAKLAGALNVGIPDWKQSLKNFLENAKNEKMFF